MNLIINGDQIFSNHARFIKNWHTLKSS
jgi:hypothetical protein